MQCYVSSAAKYNLENFKEKESLFYFPPPFFFSLSMVPFSSVMSKMSSFIISFLFRELPLAILLGEVCCWWILLVFVHLRIFWFPFHSWSVIFSTHLDLLFRWLSLTMLWQGKGCTVSFLPGSYGNSDSPLSLRCHQGGWSFSLLLGSDDSFSSPLGFC